MKKINILYWVFTVLLAGLMLMSGIMNLLVTKESIDMVSTKLGYPQYFIPFIGLAKTLGAIVLFIPGFPRIKEWVYAGFTFDLIAATYSGIRIGEHFSEWAGMLIFFVILAGSYIYYHKRLNAVASGYSK